MFMSTVGRQPVFPTHNNVLETSDSFNSFKSLVMEATLCACALT